MFNTRPQKKVDFQDEKKAIINFCNKYYTIEEQQEDFILLVDFLFDFGIKLAKNCFNAVVIEQVLENLIDSDKYLAEKLVTDEQVNNYRINQSIRKSVDGVNYYLNHHESRYYDSYIPNLLKDINTHFPNVMDIMPINWEKFLKDPESVYDDSKYKDFKGIETSIGLYVWLQFPECNSLATLQYNDERGRQPFQSLISSIYNHAYAVEIQNNTLDMITELKDVMNSYNIFTIQLNEINIVNPSLKACFELAALNLSDIKYKQPLKEEILSKLLEKNTYHKKLKM